MHVGMWNIVKTLNQLPIIVAAILSMKGGGLSMIVGDAGVGSFFFMYLGTYPLSHL